MTMPSSGTRTGFWPRTVALAVDVTVLIAADLLLTRALFDADAARAQALATLLGLGYFVYFWSAAGGGQTLGMKLLDLRVVTTDRTPLSVTGAITRYVGLIISCMALFIGVIWVAFDAQKQGWHDKIAGTLVVKA